MFNRKEFGLRIRELRMIQNLKQDELGEAIGLSKQAISAIETGYRSTSIEVLHSLSVFFNVSSDYLLGIEATNDK
ncbi:helix-turn-helix domain-containing protein [Brevibacillus laterosporus]|uniref:helix-turn-helix domain-containing protein n=1 Tax=Brevibacillus laterosporus TaxID=1465 RepID=UPI000E6BB431|nr:helix-turn-helix transcriptional regulator [Brevibacillus laterosporus]AYB37569.1 XRE family transcriptional regulator [Brevibacillus laterosporus]MBM7111729.1 HTH-type transcriptional regulator ImmR [Brevibacillus laterosporus]